MNSSWRRQLSSIVASADDKTVKRGTLDLLIEPLLVDQLFHQLARLAPSKEATDLIRVTDDRIIRLVLTKAVKADNLVIIGTILDARSTSLLSYSDFDEAISVRAVDLFVDHYRRHHHRHLGGCDEDLLYVLNVEVFYHDRKSLNDQVSNHLIDLALTLIQNGADIRENHYIHNLIRFVVRLGSLSRIKLIQTSYKFYFTQCQESSLHAAFERGDCDIFNHMWATLDKSTDGVDSISSFLNTMSITSTTNPKILGALLESCHGENIYLSENWLNTEDSAEILLKFRLLGVDVAKHCSSVMTGALGRVEQCYRDIIDELNDRLPADLVSLVLEYYI
jgi:hypothetical protein